MLLYVDPINPSLRVNDPAALQGVKRQVALEELEHHFAYTLLREMRKTVPESGLLKKSQAEEMHEEMLDDALSGAMAKTGQLGIARLVEQQLRIAEMQGKWRAEIEARRHAGSQESILKNPAPDADEGIGSLGGAVS